MTTKRPDDAMPHGAGVRRERFERLLALLVERNPFYRDKLRAHGFGPERPPRFCDLPRIPFTTKEEFALDQAAHPPFGRDLTWPLERYTRLHQTSGTTGTPLRWLDDPASWRWWIECWKEVYRAAGVVASDRIFVAFSFGPFIGFWTAFEAGEDLGATVIPGGGLGTSQRLDAISENGATVLVCTPTYALRLAEVARDEGRDLASGSVRCTLHAGEPGASIASVRARIETEWGARAVDHAGATEVGAWGHGCEHPGHLHVLEEEFVAEVIDPATAQAAPRRDGVRAGELVLTNLGREGSPVVRYRTGDHVEHVQGGCPCGRTTAYLRGGVLGRVDDMVIVRGVNLFPSAIENVVREFEEIVEFEGRVEREREMAKLVLRIEVGAAARTTAEALEKRIHDRLLVRPRVEIAPAGSLPRYELKARRFRRAGGTET